eukprot:TRINITY_DN3459_c3_g1_i1.p1 TRINITY_DN3459_c3_g1~~TRINITY_DN3459_c3_g1_i1.p1  ORF type:complete len:427 (-),score=77.99 TRINITY_DN3459_c3_g1_i1:73-1224(-)
MAGLFILSLFCVIISFHTFVSACPPIYGNCFVFPPDDEWNKEIADWPVDYMSDCILQNIQNKMNSSYVHLDFAPDSGIPYVFVKNSQSLATITYGTDGNDYSDESDPGPFPIPLNAPIEGGFYDPNPTSGDRHLLSFNTENCELFEMWYTVRTSGGFECASSALWHLNETNNKRPAGYTSADAGGLPIFPGLVKFAEANTSIEHAVRFTLPAAQYAYTYPGNHFGPKTNTDPTLPPYGSRFRLKANFPEDNYSGPSLVIIKALKKYGMIFADQGTGIFISGSPDPNWENVIDQINQKHKIQGTWFEMVQSPYPLVRGYTIATPTCNGKSQNSNPNWQPQPYNENCVGPTPTSGSTTSNSSGEKNTITHSVLAMICIFVIALFF